VQQRPPQRHAGARRFETYNTAARCGNISVSGHGATWLFCKLPCLADLALQAQPQINSLVCFHGTVIYLKHGVPGAAQVKRFFFEKKNQKTFVF
jgi:hypothetical protein